MQLERVLIVVGQRSQQDRIYPGGDLRHLEGPLQSSGIVDNIDVLYYSDYPPNCDDVLINYCLEKKPQAVLLSLQNIGLLGPSFAAVRKEGEPTPDGLWQITHQLHIPTVAVWGDIHAESIAEILERYLHSITLNVIWGADTSSHKTLPLEGINYVYTGVTFDERLFNIPEGVRDMPVGFHGSLSRNRPQWIAGLMKLGVPIYTADGRVLNKKRASLSSDKDTPSWVPYEEYYRYMSRLKIVLNFSALTAETNYQPVVPSDRGPVSEALYWPISKLKRPYRGVKLVISSWRNPVPAVRSIISTLKNSNPVAQEPRYQVRSRVWEALWLRTFLLEEENPVTSVYFEPYADYVPFTTLQDLIDKIRYYLENDGERDRIRMQGRATVEKYYNARIYWENLFETIGIQPATGYRHHPGEIWNKDYLDKWYLNNPSIEEREFKVRKV
ncbi:glycosyltransferase [Chloroflexota bacterium]